MLPKKYRLPKKEIPNVVRKGKKYSNEYFDIKIWFDDKLENPKFTFIISKKVSKSAVIRNTIKRKLRAATWNLVKDKKIKTAKIVYIVRNQSVIDLNIEDLSKLLQTHNAK